MSRFPITGWPGRLEVPLAARPSRMEFLPGASWTPAEEDDDWDAYELPEEFYLREVFDVDLDDERSIRDLVSNWGFMNRYWWPRHFEPDFWDSSGEFPDEVTEPLQVFFELKMHEERFDLREQLEAAGTLSWFDDDGRRVAAHEQIEDRFWVETQDGLYLAHHAYEWIEETRLAISLLRDLSRLALSYSSSSFRALPSSWALERYELPAPQTPEAASAFLINGINAALRPMSAHLFLTAEGSERYASPYTASIVQLFNHIESRATYRQCANETCARFFVHQIEGTSQYGQHRSQGVIYCSNRCARAENQRRYRRRQKESRNAEGAS
jgi:hypothetical protein